MSRATSSFRLPQNAQVVRTRPPSSVAIATSSRPRSAKASIEGYAAHQDGGSRFSGHVGFCPMSDLSGRMWVREPDVCEPGLVGLGRCHGRADGPPGVNPTGDGPGPCRGRRLGGRRACPVGSAGECWIGRRIARGDPHRHPTRAVGGPQPGQDLRAPRYRAPAASRRPGDGDRGAPGLCQRSVAAHPPAGPLHPGQAQEVIAAIGEALADAQGDRRGADRGDHGYSDRGVGRRADDGGGGGRWPRWHQLTSTAAHRGRLCFGPTQGPG
jgi:hypothetical protein